MASSLFTWADEMSIWMPSPNTRAMTFMRIMIKCFFAEIVNGFIYPTAICVMTFNSITSSQGQTVTIIER